MGRKLFNSSIQRSGFIPKSHLESFEKMIKRFDKKAQKLELERINFSTTGNEEIREIQHFQLNEDRELIPAYKRKYKFIEVMVFGRVPVLDGWMAIGFIEHFSDSANMVTNLSKDYPLGKEWYNNVESKCDHCRHNRYRKKTFVLKNFETKEEMQVGSSCLNDFIPSMNTERLLNSFSWINTIEEIFSEDQWNHTNIHDTNFYHETENVIRHAVYQIKKYGFVSKQKAFDEGFISSAESVRNNMKNPDINEYVGQQPLKLSVNNLYTDLCQYKDYLEENAKNDFECNVLSMLKSELVAEKQIPYLVAGINSFRYWIENKDKQLEDKTKSDYLFEIGKKFENHQVEVLMMKGFETRFGWSTLCLFKDNDGNKISWFASKSTNFKVGENIIISGKCKDHSIYNDEKQTKVSHIKVV